MTAISPSWKKTSRSAAFAANAMSWVTRATAMPSSDLVQCHFGPVRASEADIPNFLRGARVRLSSTFMCGHRV